MAKYVDSNGLKEAFKIIKENTLSADDTVTATTGLNITSANNVSKSVSASSNTNLWTSSATYTDNVLVNATVTFPNTGGSVRSVRINGTEYSRAYPSGTGATIVTVTKILNLASATNISINVTHNATSAMTVTLNNVSIVQL